MNERSFMEPIVRAFMLLKLQVNIFYIRFFPMADNIAILSKSVCV